MGQPYPLGIKLRIFLKIYFIWLRSWMPAVNHLRVVSHSLKPLTLRGHIYNLFIAVDSDPGGYRAGRATC